MQLNRRPSRLTRRCHKLGQSNRFATKAAGAALCTRVTAMLLRVDVGGQGRMRGRRSSVESEVLAMTENSPTVQFRTL